MNLSWADVATMPLWALLCDLEMLRLEVEMEDQVKEILEKRNPTKKGKK